MMSFRMRRGRASFSVGRRGPRANYRMGCALPVAVLLVGVVVAACTTSAESPGSVGLSVAESAAQSTAPSEAVSVAPSVAAQQPITIKGKGISKSAPFHLAGGSYAVTWTAKASDSVGCYHGASLARADGTYMFEVLANEIISDAKPHTGSTNVYNVDDAQYYIDGSSGCTWSFTFTLQ